MPQVHYPKGKPASGPVRSPKNKSGGIGPRIKPKKRLPNRGLKVQRG